MSEGDKTSKKRKKKELDSSVADEGLRGLFTRLPLPGVNGHAGGSLSIQDSDEGERRQLLHDEESEEEEEPRESEKDLDGGRESEEARMFRIQSVGSSEMSASVAVARPVIKVTMEEEEEDHREQSEKREKELAGGTLPSIHPTRPVALNIPSDRRKRGGSAGPFTSYGAVDSGSINVKRRSPSHSPSTSPTPGRRRMRKTISGEQQIFI